MKKIRIGNDISIAWTLKSGEEAYNLAGRRFEIRMFVSGNMIAVASPSVSGNVISFIFRGKDQRLTGTYSLLYVENPGQNEMVAFDERAAFELVSHSWQTGGKNKEGIQAESVEITSSLSTNAPTYDEIIAALGYVPDANVIEVIKVNGTPQTPDPEKAVNLIIPDASGKADKVSGATAGHIATLDSSGNLVDSGKGISDINPLWGNIQGSIANQTDLMDALDAKYEKPSTGIPASDLAAGVIPDVSNFITASVDNLVNYYLKSETYTKAEVQALIGAIQQFHYEIYASTAAVTNPQGNVLYLIGPTGSGEDRYEEYVYDSTKATPWVKIGDTSIDLSNYVTTSDLNTALSAYTTSAELSDLLDAKQDVINDLDDIRDGAAAGATAYQKPQTGIPASDLAAGVIPTVPTDVVKYSSQSLTDAQKTQARTNIGAYAKPEGGIPAADIANGVIPDVELFLVKYGVTSLADISEAYDAGKVVMCDDAILSVIIADEYAKFFAYDADTSKIVVYIVNNNDTWSNEARYVSNFDGKYSSLTGKPTIPDVTGKADKVSGAINGHLAGLDSNGNLADSGKSASDFAVEANPTVPSGTTPETMETIKIGSQYYELGGGTIDAEDYSGVAPVIVNPSNYYTKSETEALVETPVASTQPSGGFLPNVIYDLGEITGSVTFALATPTDNTIANTYVWTFETGSTAPTIAWPSNLTWLGGSAPTINTGKHYEITIRKGYANCLEF